MESINTSKHNIVKDMQKHPKESFSSSSNRNLASTTTATSNTAGQSTSTSTSSSSPSTAQRSSKTTTSTTTCVARQHPTIAWVPALLFLALCTAGLVTVCSTLESEQDVARREALELAVSTGAWFSDQLDMAILPLFSLAQFATELDVFAHLPTRIGAKDAPGALPLLPKPDATANVPTHRNVTGVCTESTLVERYNQIASTIKRNAGMQGVLVNLQLAPQAVVCLSYPLNNTEDFADGIYMDNTGAVGHDLLHDPARSFIAQATVPAESVVIAGPLSLAQCQKCDPTVEKALIARLPIASSTNTIEVDGVPYPRWGFAVAIINWKALVERSNIYENFSSQGLTFRLTRTDHVLDKNGQQQQTKVVVLAEAPNWDHGKWKTVAVALETTNNQWEMTVGYQDVRDEKVIMAVVAVVAVSILLGTFLYMVMAQKQSHANFQEEQAALLVKSAQDATEAERELNDYIAHEVRNPLSAAIAASSFVTAAVEHLSSSSSSSSSSSLSCTSASLTIDQRETLKSIREDMVIVDQSLHFINELLRTMLDMHRAASQQIRLQVTLLSVRDDIFMPVKGMLYQRDETFQLQIDCDPDLTIQADRLRVQQCMLNLARNSSKFVQRGFIRLRATAIPAGQDEEEGGVGHVALFVEDSGPGIPLEKRRNLFRRYQESLDSLNQGTGVGLYLCKKLVDNMEGEIYLDETFDSGVEGFPGTRIVVKLPTVVSFSTDTWTETETTLPVASQTEQAQIQGTQQIASETPKDPARPNIVCLDGSSTPRSESGASLDDKHGNDKTLPENLNVLLVDDDHTLRKLARRSLARLVPTWNIWEASSGEMALDMATRREEHVTFDIIFMDQYMATAAGQALKGTETTRQLRAHGFRTSLICGLSANDDMKGPFLNCGANAFWLKPFPCQLPELERALQSLLALKMSNEQDSTRPGV